MLRSKWESLKKSTKKEYGEYRQNLYRTGGGPSVELKLNGVGNRILGIIGVGATGTISLHDSDFVAQESGSGNELTETVQIVEEVPVPVENLVQISPSTVADNVEIINLPSTQPISNWNSWNPQQLRKPMSKQLHVSNPLLLETDSPTAACKKGPLVKPEINTPTIESTRNTPQTPKSDFNSTKRKRIYKTESTSSKLHKQRLEPVFEQLARKKIEYIDFQINLLKQEAERKEKRLAEKHEIEMQILQLELKNKEKRQI